VAGEFLPYAQKINEEMRNLLLRAEVDDSTDTIGKKVRNAVTRKIPNIWVVGAREAEAGTVTWRRYASEKQAAMSAAKAKDILLSMVRERTMDNFGDVELPEVS
jgi:threonyl-tRNA synthetase